MITEELVNDATNRLFDLLEDIQEDFNPAQASVLLVSIGSYIAFLHAPNKEEAMRTINYGIKTGEKKIL